jgi:hypothetical protein
MTQAGLASPRLGVHEKHRSMRTYLSLLVIVAATVAGPQAVAQDFRWQPYVNARYGFSIDVPTGYLLPLPPPPNGDGLAFENADRTVHVAVFGAMNALEWSFGQYYQAALGDPGLGRVTYKRKADRWYVLSGYRNVDIGAGPQEMIFYTRIAIDDAGTAISGLNMLFPPSMKEFMDPIVTRMSLSLKPPNLPDG